MQLQGKTASFEEAIDCVDAIRREGKEVSRRLREELAQAKVRAEEAESKLHPREAELDQIKVLLRQKESIAQQRIRKLEEEVAELKAEVTALKQELIGKMEPKLNTQQVFSDGPVHSECKM